MRVLAFNHFFDQDLDALASELNPGDTLDVIPYQRLFRLARRYFPQRAFESIDGSFRDDMADARRRFEAPVCRFADWLVAAYRPTIFVVPNDSFFYLRPVVERLRAHSIPTATVEKETTISPMTMETTSAEIREFTPPLSVVMTVCSERHREFAIRCGAQPDRVVITGQPRFDRYANADEISSRVAQRVPTLLYLSFDDIAYLPEDARETGFGTWRPMRQAIESVLRDLADSGAWRVVVKTHPQQQTIDDWLGTAAIRAPRDADTRDLIVEADAVVGFQTTAVFEAVLAGRPVVYPAWGPIYEKAKPLLIPFDEYTGLVNLATDPEMLRALLSQPPASIPRADTNGRAIAESHLGVVDGHATERVIALLRAHERPPRETHIGVRAQDRLRARVKGMAAPLVKAGGHVSSRVGATRLGDAACRRAEQWDQESDEEARIRQRP